MRIYVIVTGVAFLLLALVHIARLVADGGGPLDHPHVVAITLVALGLSVWAYMVIRRPQS